MKFKCENCGNEFYKSQSIEEESFCKYCGHIIKTKTRYNLKYFKDLTVVLAFLAALPNIVVTLFTIYLLFIITLEGDIKDLGQVGGLFFIVLFYWNLYCYPFTIGLSIWTFFRLKNEKKNYLNFKNNNMLIKTLIMFGFLPTGIIPFIILILLSYI